MGGGAGASLIGSRHRAMKRDLAEAERRGDPAQVEALEAQLKELSERIPGLETKFG